MKILALEFSSAERSVTVAQANPASPISLLASVKDPDFRGVTGMALIDRAMKQAGATPAEISTILLGLGPGSYTGIRSSIAIAQGWQLGRGISVTGLSSSLCLAEEVRRRGIRGEIAVIIDAQRGDVYFERFHLYDHGATSLEPLKIVPSTAILQGIPTFGAEASKFISGAVDLSPSAETLATLLHLGAPVPAESLEPIYLRESTFVKAPPSRQIAR